MSSEDKMYCYIWISIAILAATCAMGGCHEMQSTEREAMKDGLIQKQQPSSFTAVWTKKD